MGLNPTQATHELSKPREAGRDFHVPVLKKLISRDFRASYSYCQKLVLQLKKHCYRETKGCASM